jgi:hypothetical protein
MIKEGDKIVTAFGTSAVAGATNMIKVMKV